MDLGIVPWLTSCIGFGRYMDGQRLMPDDEKAVMQRLLAYHPHCEDKIGCGLDSIMVRVNYLSILLISFRTQMI